MRSPNPISSLCSSGPAASRLAFVAIAGRRQRALRGVHSAAPTSAPAQSGDDSARSNATAGTAPKGAPGFQMFAPKPRYRPQTDATTAADIAALVPEAPPAEQAAVPQGKDQDKEKITRQLSLVQHFGKLQQMMASRAPLPTTYAYLKTEIYPLIRQGVHVPVQFYGVVTGLMKSMCEAKCVNWDPRLPPAAESFRILSDVAGLQTELWSAVMSRLLEKLFITSTPAGAGGAVEMQEEWLHAQRELMIDLVESWKIFTKPKDLAIPPAKTGEPFSGFWFPRVDTTLLNRVFADNFVLGVSGLFPARSPGHAGQQKISVLAIASYMLLTDVERSSESTRRDAATFITRMGWMLGQVGITQSMLVATTERSFPVLLPLIKDQWPRLSAVITSLREAPAEEFEASSTSTHRPTIAQVPPPPAGLLPDEFFIEMKMRLRWAFESHNCTTVTRFWEQCFPDTNNIPPDRAASFRQHPEMFDLFLHAYLTLNQTEKAILVWDTLLGLNIRPTLRTFNMMLDGCRNARNVTGFENFWKRLVSFGIDLDTHIWTTRLTGLIEMERLPQAIAALEEMVTIWKAANARGEPSKAVEPTIAAVNAVIVGLLRRRDQKSVVKLLRWAQEQGIRPDVFTYNLLLRPLINERRDSEVSALLKNMEAAKIAPDEATFTVILSGTLARAESQDMAQIVRDVFAHMEQCGLEANQHTYGKIIYLILQKTPSTTSTATAVASPSSTTTTFLQPSFKDTEGVLKTVLDHMHKRGIELSKYTLTCLVDHYFAQSPPNIPAVERLVTRRQLLSMGVMDRVFYNRLIYGYGIAGHPGPAMAVWRQLREAGFLADLAVLLPLLRALWDANALAEARELVQGHLALWQRVQREGDREYGQLGQGRYWRHAFWHFAGRCGLLSGEMVAGLRRGGDEEG